MSLNKSTCSPPASVICCMTEPVDFMENKKKKTLFSALLSLASFHTISMAVFLSQSLCFTPSSFQSSHLPPPLCNQSCKVQCLQGPPRGLPVWPICFTTHLNLHSLHSLWSDYRRRNRKYLPGYTQPVSNLPQTLPHSLSHARPVGGHLISRLTWSLFTQGILVAQQSFGKSVRVCQTELNDSISVTACCR